MQNCGRRVAWTGRELPGGNGGRDPGMAGSMPEVGRQWPPVAADVESDAELAERVLAQMRRIPGGPRPPELADDAAG